MLIHLRLTHRSRAYQALWVVIFLLALTQVVGAKGKLSVEGTAEWGRLGELWKVMLDHSSGIIYSPERFRKLTPNMSRADADLTALIAQKRLPAEAGEALRRLFHARYSYITDHHYLAQSQQNRTAFVSAQQTSQWVIEMQLALLRKQYGAAPPDEKLRKGGEAALAFELAFQQQCAALSDELEQRRKKLTEKEAQQQPVDWNSLEEARRRRETALHASYQARRISFDRGLRRLMPYVLSLTQPRASRRE